MILGHERQIAYLKNVFRRGKFSHAYFFFGPAHVGKFTVAQEIAKSFHCQNYRGSTSLVSLGDACGECRDCALIGAGAHPHVVILDTAHTLLSKKEARKDIPIEDIRELKRVFSFTPSGDMWRIAIINEAEKLSAEAADAFLKLLEEPGKQTLFLLISESRDLVRPTIVSRAHPIYFSLVSNAILGDFLSARRIDQKTSATFLTLAAGRPGVLMRLFSDRAHYEEEEQLARAVRELEESHSAAAALLFSDRVYADPRLRERAILAILQRARERLIVAANSGVEIDDAVRLIHAIDRIVFLLATTNVNPRLAMDLITLEMGNNKSRASFVA